MNEPPANNPELVLSRDEVRKVDQIAIIEFGIPGILLMENAGRGVYEQLRLNGCQGPVLICCGPGNNGGDGFVVARHLDNHGIAVNILLAGRRGQIKGDADINLKIIERMGIPVFPFETMATNEFLPVLDEPPEWVVDALLGTGAAGPPRPPLDRLINKLNRIPAKRLAIDIPTGMECDTGECHQPTFKADLTCTFVALKPAFYTKSGQSFSGKNLVIDIGVPREVIQRAMA